MISYFFTPEPLTQKEERELDEAASADNFPHTWKDNIMDIVAFVFLTYLFWILPLIHFVDVHFFHPEWCNADLYRHIHGHNPPMSWYLIGSVIDLPLFLVGSARLNYRYSYLNYRFIKKHPFVRSRIGKLLVYLGFMTSLGLPILIFCTNITC